MNQVSDHPKVRFSEFIDKWEGRYLNEILAESKKRNLYSKFTKNDVLSVSGEYGIVNQITHLGRSYAGKSVLNYHVVQIGDVVYTKSPLKKNPFGIIKTNIKKAGIVSTLYAVYTPKNGELGQFLDYYFQLDDHLNKYLRPLVHKGAKNDMKINNQQVLTNKINTPTINEQQKIVDFLSEVDCKLKLLTIRNEFLSDFRDEVVEQVFKQKIRFKSADGKNYPDWQTVKIGDVFKQKVERYTSGLELLSVTINSGVKRRSDIEGKDNSSNDKSNYKRVYKGDIVYNSMRMWQGASGTSDYDGIVSPAYTILAYNNLANSSFYSYHFKLKRMINIFQRNSQGLTSDTWNLKYPQLSKIKILKPSLEEQNKIVDFLKLLDEKKGLLQKELEQVKMFKKGLLQQMFI